MSGRSKIRNRIVAEVFSRMEIVESRGTGIKRIMKRAKEYGLPETRSGLIFSGLELLLKVALKLALKLAHKLAPNGACNRLFFSA